jgi:hypothetical protein
MMSIGTKMTVPRPMERNTLCRIFFTVKPPYIVKIEKAP